MNKTMKTLLSVACVCTLVVSTIIGTVAYLTASKSVTNTFTVGDVNIKLEETLIKDGEATNEKTEVGNQYHMVPGESYVKDPTVTIVAGSEPCYVRMLVTLNKVDVLMDALGDDFLPQNYVEGWDAEKWECVKITDKGNNVFTYEFRYKTTVDASEEEQDKALEPLFTKINVPGTFTNEDLKALYGTPAQGQEVGEFNILVEAHAIQAATFANADAAWAAFDVQNAQ